MTAEKDSRYAPQVDYDTFVNWPARLEREAPFFRRVLGEVGADYIVDVGAGSARHSIMFATWGLTVDAIDPDDSMLAAAAANIADASQKIAEADGAVRLLRGGFGQLAGLGLADVDAVICTGNALPHVDGIEGLRAALADFSAVVRPGGVVVLHLLNHALLLDKRPRVIPPVVRDTAEGTLVFLRVLDYPEDRDVISFDFVTMTRDAEGRWELASRRSDHTALPPLLLREELENAGFHRIELLGGHDGHQLTESDESVIVVAYRR